jgi:hypothetical protein
MGVRCTGTVLRMVADHPYATGTEKDSEAELEYPQDTDAAMARQVAVGFPLIWDGVVDSLKAEGTRKVGGWDERLECR